MPLFEYECLSCGKRFELLVRADTKPSCPMCGKARLEKLMSAFAAHSGGDEGVPPCRREGSGCGPGKCGSGRCGIE
jgi:putative FmdB family regulatory protein